MISITKLLLRILPWLLTVGLLSWMLFEEKLTAKSADQTESTTYALLTRVQQIGKLELIKYNFQEITEIKKIAEEIDLKIFKYKPVPDSKGVLISQGSAVGCLDLTFLTAEDVTTRGDTLFLRLPDPELCYFKIDLERSQIYDLKVEYMRSVDRQKFIEQLYRVAEQQIHDSAIQSGILEETKNNAHRVLRPMLETISGKVVLLSFAIPMDQELSPR